MSKQDPFLGGAKPPSITDSSARAMEKARKLIASGHLPRIGTILVPSERDPGKTYTLRITTWDAVDVALECECRAAEFRNGSYPIPCYHAAAAVLMLTQLGIASYRPDGTVGTDDRRKDLP